MIKLHHLSPIHRAYHFESETAQELGRHRADDVVVIHEEHPAIHQRGGHRRSRGGLLGLFVQSRQPDPEGGAAPHLRFHLDMTAMLFDDGVNCGETEAAAGFFGREIRIEDAGEIFLRDAFARVRDCDQKIITRSQAGMGQASQPVVAGFHLQSPTAGHRLHGIDREILHHAPDLALVRIGRPEIGREIINRLHLRSMQRKRHHLADNRVQFDGGPHGFAAFGKGEQLLREITRSVRRLFRRPQADSGRRIRRHIEHTERNVAHDGGQDVVEIMRDAAGEHADRFQPGRAHEFLFEPFVLGHITKHQNRTNHGTLGGMDRRTTSLDQAVGPIGRHEPGLRRQIDDHITLRHARDRHLHRTAVVVILKHAYFPQQPAGGQAGIPLGQRRGGGIDEQNPARHIGGDHALRHRPQGDRQPFLLLGQRSLRLFQFREIDINHDRLRQVYGRLFAADPPPHVHVTVPAGDIMHQHLGLELGAPFPQGDESGADDPQRVGSFQQVTPSPESIRTFRPQQGERGLVYVAHPDQAGALPYPVLVDIKPGWKILDPAPAQFVQPLPHFGEVRLHDGHRGVLKQRAVALLGDAHRLLRRPAGTDISHHAHHPQLAGRLRLDRHIFAQPHDTIGQHDMEIIHVAGGLVFHRCDGPGIHLGQLGHVLGVPKQPGLGRVAKYFSIEGRARHEMIPSQTAIRQNAHLRFPQHAIGHIHQLHQLRIAGPPGLHGLTIGGDIDADSFEFPMSVAQVNDGDLFMDPQHLIPHGHTEILLVAGQVIAHGVMAGRFHLGQLRHFQSHPRHVAFDVCDIPGDPPEKFRRGHKPFPMVFALLIPGDIRLPEQAVRMGHQLIQLFLARPPGNFRRPLGRDVGRYSHEGKTILPQRPDHHALLNPERGARLIHNLKDLFIPRQSSGQGGPRALIHFSPLRNIETAPQAHRRRRLGGAKQFLAEPGRLHDESPIPALRRQLHRTLPQQTVGLTQQLPQASLGFLLGNLGFVPGRDIGDDADQFPLVGPAGLDAHIFTQPDVAFRFGHMEHLLVARGSCHHCGFPALAHLPLLRHADLAPEKFAQGIRFLVKYLSVKLGRRNIN